MDLSKWMPRRKVAAGGLAGALAVLVIAFLPRAGVVLTDDEKAAVQGALIALISSGAAAYLIPSEQREPDGE
jgi:hypothetical protein